MKKVLSGLFIAAIAGLSAQLALSFSLQNNTKVPVYGIAYVTAKNGNQGTVMFGDPKNGVAKGQTSTTLAIGAPLNTGMVGGDYLSVLTIKWVSIFFNNATYFQELSDGALIGKNLQQLKFVVGDPNSAPVVPGDSVKIQVFDGSTKLIDGNFTRQ
jgi:hypothetical protein